MTEHKPTYQPVFQHLGPAAHDDINSIYSKALNDAVTNKDVFNIALTGPYGAGKSSILKRFEQDKPSQINILKISLAAFETDDQNGPTENNSLENSSPENNRQETSKSQNENKKNDKPEGENKKNSPAESTSTSTGIAKDDLEMRILQQIIYSVDIHTLPQSRFQRITAHRNYQEFAFAATFWLLGFWMLTKGWEQFLKLPEWGFLWVMNIALFFATFVITALGIERFLKELTRSGIKKVSLTKLEVEAGGSQQSVLSQFLDEILYFFEETDCNTVIFEDIDRFDDPNIFVKLREINTIINNNAGIKTKHHVSNGGAGNIRFIYALKDAMFSEKQRTKFFDLIVPVVPVLNHGNADKLFFERIEQIPYLKNSIDSHFVMDIAEYLNDARVIHNTFNELVVYAEVIQVQGLNPNNMLAVILYKNLFSKDFELLHNREGFFWFLLESRDTLQEENAAALKKRITEADNKVFEAEQKNAANLDSLKRQKRELHRQPAKLPTAKLADLLSSNPKFVEKRLSDYQNRHAHSGINPKNQAWRLLKFLLLNGFLNEDFLTYISAFNAQPLWTPSDREFYTCIKSGEPLPEDISINNPATILRRLNDKDYAHPAVLNVALFDAALDPNQQSKTSAQQQRLFAALKVAYEGRNNMLQFHELIMQYGINGIQRNHFYERLLQWIPAYFDDLFVIEQSELMEDSEKLFESINADDIKHVLRAANVCEMANQHKSETPRKVIQILFGNYPGYFFELLRDYNVTEPLWENLFFFQPEIRNLSELMLVFEADSAHQYLAKRKALLETPINDLLTQLDEAVIEQTQQYDVLSDIFYNLLRGSLIKINVNNILLLLAQQRIAVLIEEFSHPDIYLLDELSLKDTKPLLAQALQPQDNSDTLNYAKALSHDTWAHIRMFGTARLHDNLKRRINDYIAHYMLQNPDNRGESEESMRDILNTPNLETELGIKAIEHQHCIFESLNNISEDYWQTLVIERKIAPSWQTLKQIFQSDLVTQESVSEYLNQQNVADRLAETASSESFGDSIYPQLRAFILASENIDNTIYIQLLSCFNVGFSTLPEIKSESKLEALIEAGLIEFNSATFRQISEINESKQLKLAFIANNERGFITALNKGAKFALVDSNTVENLLTMNVSDKLKIALTAIIEPGAFSKNTNLTKLAAPYYLRLPENKRNPDVLAQLCRLIDNDHSLSAKLFTQLMQAEQSGYHLSLLTEKAQQWPAQVIADVLQQHPNKQLRALVDNPPRSVKTDASNAIYFLLQALQNKQLVASISEDEDKFRVETQIPESEGFELEDLENEGFELEELENEDLEGEE